MANQDTCCTLVPYFKVNAGKLNEFKKLCDEFVEKTKSEPGCLHYAFSFDGDAIHCREGYTNAEALLAHLENVGAVLQQALAISEIARLEVHAPAAELDKLRKPLADLKPQMFAVEMGFRK